MSTEAVQEYPCGNDSQPSAASKASQSTAVGKSSTQRSAGDVRRVCCLCERWESGGIESFLCNVFTRMELRDLTVDIVASSLGESIFTRSLEKHGVHFFELSGSQRNVPENHRRFRELLKERKYDVVQVNAFHGLTLAYLRLAAEAGVPVRIAHGHNTALRWSLTRPLKMALHAWAKGRFTGYATELWACSKGAAAFLFSKKELRKWGFTFIPNGIDVERFRFDQAAREQTRRELGIENCFVAGNVGRLCYQKNQSFLLEVLAELVKVYPASRLLLVGEGEDRDKLIKRARELGLTDKTLFLGNRRDVERLYWAMDVFAFPSRFEGFGIAAIEAQAAGLPVFCSEAVPEEARVTALVKALPLDPKAWAEALRTIPERRRVEKELVSGLQIFDIARTAGLIESRMTGKK